MAGQVYANGQPVPVRQRGSHHNGSGAIAFTVPSLPAGIQSGVPLTRDTIL